MDLDPAAVPLEDGISVVVPVYNSQETLRDLARRLEAVLPTMTPSFEVILVNDGSRDRSWDVVRELCDQYPFVTGINLLRNSGQHNALLCGVRAARKQTIVTIDDDLQNPPEEIPKLLALLDAGADVAYGRPQTEQHGLLRDLASVITKIVLQNAMGADNARHISAFRAFRTRLRAAFAHYRNPYVSLDVLLTWGTSKFDATIVRHEPRAAGVSNYTVGKLVTHAFNMMTGFSTAPLRLASMMGFCFTLFGIGVLAYVVIRYLFAGTAVQGFPFLASIIAIFSGAQLFALGVIGEYLARMHFRMMDRPTYVVDEIRTPATAAHTTPGGVMSGVVLACATARGLNFFQKLSELTDPRSITVCCFREEPHEPPFLDGVAGHAAKVGSRFFETKDLGAGQAGAFLESHPFDLLFAVSWRYMIPHGIYSRAAKGSYVFHDSLLPKYRGFAPTVWAVANGESQTGAALFEMSERVDEGDVVGQHAVPIGPHDTIADVMQRVTGAYLFLLDQYLPALLTGAARKIPQDHAAATYGCKRLPEDNVIDWTRPCRDVYNLIRATTDPYPGAFTHVAGRRLIIWHATPADGFPTYVGRIPGRVVELSKSPGPVILCGEGALRLHTVQWAGSPSRQSAGDVIDKLSLTLGR